MSKFKIYVMLDFIVFETIILLWVTIGEFGIKAFICLMSIGCIFMYFIKYFMEYLERVSKQNE